MTTGEPGKRARVLSGMRPTGRLHIGHYFGALQNWVRLQNATMPDSSSGTELPSSVSPLATRHSPLLPAYDCFYFIADWHALTSDYADTSAVAQNTIEIVTDYLAAGLDPQKSVIFQQSLVPEHAELHLLLSMVTPLGWLERVPTYKEALENIKDKDLHNYGFLGYPILQCADIVMYSSPAVAGNPGAELFVPVGEDQVSHVELSREIVRTFHSHTAFRDTSALYVAALANRSSFAVLMEKLGWRFPIFVGDGKFAYDPLEFSIFFKKKAYEMGFDNFLQFVGVGWASYFEYLPSLVEPMHKLAPTPRIPGLDGRKMSKSYGNAITLSESDADIRAKTKVMVTDPARKRRTDPGNPDVCPVYDWHKLFSAEEPGRLEWVRQGCTTAGIGCIECKAAMAENLIKWIAPVRERRQYYEGKRKLVREIVRHGSLEARKVAMQTMRRVRDAVLGKGRILRPTLKVKGK